MCFDGDLCVRRFHGEVVQKNVALLRLVSRITRRQTEVCFVP